MSGTSLDGLDIAHCTFRNEDDQWSFKLNAYQSIAYDRVLRSRLKQSIKLSALDLLLFNNEYGKWLGEQLKYFIKAAKVQVDFVASHGHTVFHQPDKGVTYQIGAGQEIARVSGLKTICDFRSKDVSLGGQGAPLVPVGDKYLFSDYDFCLNLGGISNVSFDHNGERVAYDIGLANMLLNYITNKIDLPYDEGGRLAESGMLDEDLFKRLNTLAYYQQPFPKSTGYEWFSEEVMPIIEASDQPLENKLCTAVHHIAFTVADDIKRFAKNESRVLVTGGGAQNTFLIEVLRNYLSGSVKVVIPSNEIIEFKEAMIFAFLGVLKSRNEVNGLRSVTGASVDSCGGVVYNP